VGPGRGTETIEVEADPIRCWWRTSAGAVRIGEPFSLVLTCAVVENETSTVVPDQSQLEPSAIQLPPFEVVAGERGPDLRTDQRRFFQYRYELRLISEDLFGKDAKIPGLPITYHLETRAGRGELVRGRDQTYLLPPTSVRILSLVPNDAADIRDAASWTFADIETERFRARAWFVVAGILFAAATLVLVVTLVRLVGRARREGALGRPLLSDAVILRAVGRELAAVKRDSERADWNSELAARALAAFRVAAAIALGRRVSQRVAVRPGSPGSNDGQLPVRHGWVRGTTVLVSASTTSDAMARELALNPPRNLRQRQRLEHLQAVLSRFTAAQFGRGEAADPAALGEALHRGLGVLGRLTFEHRWITRRLKSMTELASAVGSRAWSRYP
jgi:hypothetical protein